MCKECHEPGKKYCTELTKTECKKGMKRGDIMRTEMHNIKQLITKNRTIELNEGQYFAETPRCYEIWQEKPLPQRIKTIRKTSVLWVIEK